MRSGAWLLAALSSSWALAACGERPQTAAGQRKPDVQAFQGAASAFNASGWTPGDAASWEQQIKTRAQGQNEYSRTTP